MNSIQCPICNSNRNKFIGNPIMDDKCKVLVKQTYSSFNCLECNYYYSNPNIELSEKEWDQLYSQSYFGDTTKWWAKKRQKERSLILSSLKKLSKSEITNFLEIGCGEGYILIDALKVGWNVKGIDVYDNRIESAKNPAISFEIGDIHKAQFPENNFDCIYIDSVLEHVPNPVGFISELKRILRPNGLIYIAVPNEDALIYTVKRTVQGIPTFQPLTHPYHINGFTKKSLLKAIQKQGFKVLWYRNYAGWYEFLKFRFMSKSFIKALVTLPIHLLAIILRKQFYQDLIIKKV